MYPGRNPCGNMRNWPLLQVMQENQVTAWQIDRLDASPEQAGPDTSEVPLKWAHDARADEPRQIWVEAPAKRGMIGGARLLDHATA